VPVDRESGLFFHPLPQLLKADREHLWFGEGHRGHDAGEEPAGAVVLRCRGLIGRVDVVLHPRVDDNLSQAAPDSFDKIEPVSQDFRALPQAPAERRDLGEGVCDSFDLFFPSAVGREDTVNVPCLFDGDLAAS
jgi:hypothetical protein